MPDITGKEVLIYQGDGATPTENFTLIACSQSDQITITNSEVESNTKKDTGFRGLFAPGTVKSVSMSIRGVFEEDASHEALLNLAISTTPRANFIFALGGSRQLRGEFQVSQYEHSGEVEGTAQFSAQFASNGIITLEAATV